MDRTGERQFYTSSATTLAARWEAPVDPESQIM
jgi:hypothetical protein